MASFQHKISHSLKCPICLELLSDPKRLSCSHTFCKNCLGNILACSSQNTGISLTCPICRNTTNVKDGNVVNLRTNVLLKSRVDKERNSKQFCETCDSIARSKAVHFCAKCGKNMCDTCLEIHNKWPPHLKHKVVRVEDVREGRVVFENEVYCSQKHKSDKQKYVCTDVCITCKMLICKVCVVCHKKNGDTVQSTAEYNASIKKKIESQQARSKTKTTTIKDHMTYIKTQKKRVSDQIDRRRAEVNKIYEESIKKLNDWKAETDKQLKDQGEKLRKRLDEMNDADEKLITSIESASVLVGKSLKAPLEGDIIAIRDSLSGVLKNVLDRNDPEKKLATHVADRAEQLMFTPNHQGDHLNIGEVGFMKCALKGNEELSKESDMNGMAVTPDGIMAVWYCDGQIDIFSADGQLQQRVRNNFRMCYGIRFLSSGGFVILTDNGLTLHTREGEKVGVTYETRGRFSCFTADSNDLICVAYKKGKFQVFSPRGGKAIREIPCDGYKPKQITSYNDLLIIQDGNVIRIVDREGNAKHKIDKSNISPYAAVTQNNSVLIAWVKHDDGLVSIDEYTDELKHIQTLVSNHKIEKPDNNWYYLQEFRSGEIAFCTPDRLYIFKQPPVGDTCS